MIRKQKVQRAMGTILLVALIVPIVVLSVPATHTALVLSTDPETGLVKPVYIDVTYTPLIKLLGTVDGTPDDVSLLAVYAGLFGLAVWLIARSARPKVKEA